MKTIKLAAALLAAALSIPAASSGPPNAEEHSQTVGFADLDLTTQRGVATFDRRIANAVRTVCGWEDPRDLAIQRAVRECRNQAFAGIADAREAVILAAQRGQSIRVAQLIVRR